MNSSGNFFFQKTSVVNDLNTS